MDFGRGFCSEKGSVLGHFARKKGFYSGILLGKRDFTHAFGSERGISFADLARKKGFHSGISLGNEARQGRPLSAVRKRRFREFTPGFLWENGFCSGIWLGRRDFTRGFRSEEGILLGDFARKKGLYSEALLGKRDFTRGFCSEKNARAKKCSGKRVSTRDFAQNRSFSGIRL